MNEENLEGFTVANFPSREEVIRSASFISHTPERYYELELHDYETFVKKIIDTLKGLPKEKVQEFLNWATKGYIDRYKEMLHFRGRVASPLVVGPSKFPSQEKKLESLEKREKELENFKEKALKKAEKLAKSRGLSELEATKTELEELKHTLEVMKEANKIVRSKKLSEEEKEKKLREIGAFEIEGYSFYWPEPDFMGRIGFPPFELESVRRAINAREEKLKRLEEKEEHKGEVNVVEETKDYKIVEDYTKDRVLIYFTTIPLSEVREALKSKGFRWSPHWKAWSRKLTKAAVEDAKGILAKFYEEGEKPVWEMKEKEPWEMTREEFIKADENRYVIRETELTEGKGYKVYYIADDGTLSPVFKENNRLAEFKTKEGAKRWLKGFHEKLRYIVEGKHKYEIEQALKEGKPVPGEVLKDYPDLIEKYGKAVKEQEKETLSDREMRVIERLKTLGVKIDEPPIINMVGKTKTVVGKIDNYRLNFVIGDILKEDMGEFDTLRIDDKVVWVKKSPMLSMLKEKLRRGEKKPKVMKLVPEYGGLKRFERQDMTLTEKLQLKYLKEHGNL